MSTVQLTNITVFAIMRKIVYNETELMRDVISAKRYVDDGAGLFGDSKVFKTWIDSLLMDSQSMRAVFVQQTTT